MALLIPNRPPNPFASQRRRSNLPGLNGHESRHPQPSNNGTLKLYPLEPSPARHGRAHAGRRHQTQGTPVSPLGHGNTNAALVRPEYTMAPPVRHNTMASNIAGQTMQQHSAPSIQPHPATAPRPPAGQPAMPTRGVSQPGPAATAQPPSPEQAAQHFRRTNKGLPDGVRYEPLDENTMRLLRENGHLPPIAPAAPMQASPPVSHSPSPASAPAAPTPVSPPMQPPVMQSPIASPQATPPETHSIAKTIEGLIQDERNAQVFYGHLANALQGKPMASALAHIASDNIKHIHKFTQILANHFGSSFAPVDAEINTGLELNDALALALEEENNTLRTLSELLDTVANTETEKIIQRIITKKIVNYNQLERLHALS